MDLALHRLTPDADPHAPLVVALHGITANGLTWVPLAEELRARHGDAVELVAPDLRGRAGSRDLEGPWGLRRHAADVLRILDDAKGRHVVLVGHSMGAFVAALVAEQGHPSLGATLLVDGGCALPMPPGIDVDAALQAVIGPAMTRLSMRFASPEEYLAYWEPHPAFRSLWATPVGDSVRAYLLADLVPAPDGDGLVSSCVLEAVRQDGGGVLLDPAIADAPRHAVAAGRELELLWAPRGLMDEEQGLYDEDRLAALALPDGLRVERVDDTNHYTVILAPQGVRALADAVDRHLPAAR